MRANRLQKLTLALSRVLAKPDERNQANLALMLTKTHEVTQTRVHLKQKEDGMQL
jgi:hypothetical protein